MVSIYPACFYEDEDGYSVFIPDLDGRATCGKSVEDAMEMAIDCVAGYIFSEHLEGREVPQPSALEDIDFEGEWNKLWDPGEEHPEPRGFKTMVAVDVDEYAALHFCTPVKKTLSIPRWLNEQAKAAGINFSQVLQKALKQELGLAQ